MNAAQLITLAPGHFHAALIQKRSSRGLDPLVEVYAPLDADLLAHLRRIQEFNQRANDPTAWSLQIYAGNDWAERCFAQSRGQLVMLSGRNRRKIEWMRKALDAGKHILADKPWIIEATALPELRALLHDAQSRGAVVGDMMTERWEITSILQREFVRDPNIFGTLLPGSPEQPAVEMQSVHFLKKMVAGVPLQRPPWFFDIREEGEALADVGTHLVDLVLWVLFTERPIDPDRELEFFSARRWPTRMTRDQFTAVTGCRDFPADLRPWIFDEVLHYFCNNEVGFRIRGSHMKLDVRWEYESPLMSGDTHSAAFHGSESSIEIRQPAGSVPEMYVVPRRSQNLEPAICQRLAELASQYPGLAAEKHGPEVRIMIPERFRIGHEAHFAEVLEQYLRRLRGEETIPSWETPQLLAKYHITTMGVALGRSS